ncbi:hypothetical protein DUNSADRAFT_14292 [Dunaliella salina]|uniref:Encoded protein n=1 Tax=Dunaliella salina TaxID=3046 RepID=A0ABQ7H2N2_DUNSA|nr:hypothetical protein DUNSADRAFT_14292 [Dunaliella salina]|eukprot:KAF5841117.1 hypothetical protein DUNSADRAFT_14292 [Dunaliella salina]
MHACMQNHFRPGGVSPFFKKKRTNIIFACVCLLNFKARSFKYSGQLFSSYIRVPPGSLANRQRPQNCRFLGERMHMCQAIMLIMSGPWTLEERWLPNS